MKFRARETFFIRKGWLINGMRYVNENYRSLNDDFQCIINAYLPRYKSNPVKILSKNNIDCPLGELGLIDILNKNKKTYRKSSPPTATLNPYVIFAIIQDFCSRCSKLFLKIICLKLCRAPILKPP